MSLVPLLPDPPIPEREIEEGGGGGGGDTSGVY